MEENSIDRCAPLWLSFFPESPSTSSDGRDIQQRYNTVQSPPNLELLLIEFSIISSSVIWYCPDLSLFLRFSSSVSSLWSSRNRPSFSSWISVPLESGSSPSLPFPRETVWVPLCARGVLYSLVGQNGPRLWMGPRVLSVLRSNRVPLFWVVSGKLMLRLTRLWMLKLWWLWLGGWSLLSSGWFWYILCYPESLEMLKVGLFYFLFSFICFAFWVYFSQICFWGFVSKEGLLCFSSLSLSYSNNVTLFC